MVLAAATLILLTALLPLWSLAGRSAKAVAATLTLLGALGLGLGVLAEAPAPQPVAQRPLAQADSGYVGSASCRSCHPGEHASWFRSFHRTMTQVATRDTVVAEFERLTLDWFGSEVALEWRGDRLWTRFDRRGARPAHVERPIEQLTGSHHLQVLWYSTGDGRELAPVPMCFQIETATWIPISSVFVLPPEFRDPPEPGTWNRTCTTCHATAARPRLGELGADTRVAELGIACEACHGPGERHVAANRGPIARYLHRARGGDDSIANPASLPPARSAEVCGGCHSVRILRMQHFASWNEHGSPFVPGDDLQRSHLIVGSDDRDAPELRHELRKNPHFFASNFWPDGQVRLSGREFNGLRSSPCYQHGDHERQIDCTSCHRLHPDDGIVDERWRNGQLREGMSGDAGCTQCHHEFAERDAWWAHTHHRAGEGAPSCYDCHMSYTSVGLMKASRSHAITSPDVNVELATGRPNACNQCHLDRTLAWTAGHLSASWGVRAPELDPEQRTVAASVRWLLKGDAGLRMLAAWSYGWAPAQRASGRDWQAPFLARLLDDPYYVVRFNAARSLQTLDGYGGSLRGYDFVADQADVQPFVDNVTAVWQARWTGGDRPQVLIGKRGLLRAPFARLYARRDDRKVYIAE
ncbi:MAG TPA: C cytochrome precursor [bacterium]|nr:C cytochrome precursor [bacterium]